ncbi:MAG: S8 family serine peptidase [Thermotogae bacterium]|nr:S8 family serine peptidase [Thermotogota bacterium]
MLQVFVATVWFNGHPLSASKSLKAVQRSEYFILQFRGPILPQWKEELSKLGVRFYDYLPHFAFVVKASSAALPKILDREFVSGIAPILPEYKLPPDLSSVLTCAERSGSRYKVRILLYDKEALGEVEKKLKDMGIEIVTTSEDGPFHETYLSTEEMREIARHPAVYVVEPQYPKMAFNNRNALLHQIYQYADVDAVASPDTIIWSVGIHGEGQILGHNDNGLYPSHCFFNGTVDGSSKVIALMDYDGGGFANGAHGTHTAGTAVGGTDEQTSNLQYRGMAYKARLISQEPLGGASSFYTTLNDAYALGARVHTNSWGYICIPYGTCSPSNYNTVSRDIDRFMWNNPDMLVVFAAGNHGDQGCSSGCRRAASDPASAKNDLTVAAMYRSQPWKTTWSAYGEYPDGRFSVDVLVHGNYTYSADNTTSCGISVMSGTSMATPAAAGMALLLRQYYEDGYAPGGPHTPSAALIKASMLASAVPASGDGDTDGSPPGPDNPVPNGNEGAGIPVLDNVMELSPYDDWTSLTDSSDIRKSHLWFVDNTAGISTGEEHIYRVEICNPHVVTRIVLVWTDYPASTNCNSSSCLVNDLDLKVEGPSSEVFIGNAPTSGPDNLTPNDGSIPHDRVNTWELVRIKNSSRGEYVIKVKGYNVPNGPQPYALVVSGGVGTCIVGRDTSLNVTEGIAKGSVKITGRRLQVEGADAKVAVFSPTGRRIKELHLQANSEVSLKDLSGGIYFFVIRWEDGRRQVLKVLLP